MRKQLIAGFLLVVSLWAPSTHARVMYKFDLDSLAYMSADIVEGDVVEAKTIEWSRRLTFKVSHSFAGDTKRGESITVQTSSKRGPPTAGEGFVEFSAGDKLILFLSKSTAIGNRAGDLYSVQQSGLYLISERNVVGLYQWGNPGPYVASAPEGELEDFRKHVTAAVAWSKAFSADWLTKRQDANWLLEKLMARPISQPLITLLDAVDDPKPKPVKETVPPKREPMFDRDWIVMKLCEALEETKDEVAIQKAKDLRDRWYAQYFRRADLKRPIEPSPPPGK